MQVLEYSLQDPNNKTKFLLLNGNSTENDIVMRPELDEFQKKYPGNFQVVNTLSRPPEGWTGAFVIFLRLIIRHPQHRDLPR